MVVAAVTLVPESTWPTTRVPLVTADTVIVVRVMEPVTMPGAMAWTAASEVLGSPRK